MTINVKQFAYKCVLVLNVLCQGYIVGMYTLVYVTNVCSKEWCHNNNNNNNNILFYQIINRR